MQTEKLSISLPEDMAQLVRRKVESGSYASSSEVIGDALRLLQKMDSERSERLNAIRREIDEARADPVRYTASEVREHFDRLEREAAKNP
jgi:antitoxin ParD1/3/4